MALPTALFALFGGVIADRFERHRVMIAADLGRALMGVLLIAAIASAALPTLGLYLIAGALATMTAIFFPAQQAFLPTLVGEERDSLLRADAWMVSGQNILRVAGPALAGLALAYLGARWLFAFDAASYVFSALMIVLAARALTDASAKRSLRKGPGLGKGLDGIRFLMTHEVLRPCFIAIPLIDGAGYAIAFLLPQLLQQTHVASTAHYGGLLAALSLGRAAGSFLMPRTRLVTRRGAVLALNFVLQAAALMGFVALSSHHPVLGALAFFALGLPSGAAQVSMASYVQTEVPRALRGRAFAGILVLTTAVIPLSVPLFGVLAESQGPVFTFAVISMVYLCGGVFVAAHRAVWRVS